jgi:hypothetical protein
LDALGFGGTLVLAVVSVLASFPTLRERFVRPSGPRLRGARVVFGIIAVVANGMVSTLLDVVRIQNKTFAARIRLIVRVLAAGTAWVR